MAHLRSWHFVQRHLIIAIAYREGGSGGVSRSEGCRSYGAEKTAERPSQRNFVQAESGLRALSPGLFSCFWWHALAEKFDGLFESLPLLPEIRPQVGFVFKAGKDRSYVYRFGAKFCAKFAGQDGSGNRRFGERAD